MPSHDPVADAVLEAFGSDPSIGRRDLAQRVRDRTGVPLAAAITRIRALERAGALNAGPEAPEPTGRASSSPTAEGGNSATFGRNRSFEGASSSNARDVPPPDGKGSARQTAGLRSVTGEGGTNGGEVDSRETNALEALDVRERSEDVPTGRFEGDRVSQAPDARRLPDPPDPQRLSRKTAEMRAAVSDLRSQMDQLRLSIERASDRSRPPEP